MDVGVTFDRVIQSKLPSTGVSLEWERKLSAIRITGRDYGTRSSTALLLDRYGRVRFHEKPLAPKPGEEIRINFQLS